jgi:aminoglycoside 6'-N-acetyltransferase
VALLPCPSAVEAGEGLTLRLACDDDAPLISEWTRDPLVHRRWGGKPCEVEEVLEKYTGRRAPAVVSYVISADLRPVGYLQAWQDPHRFGLDMFVAAGAQGRGLGPRAARALAAELSALGWTPLTVDPAVDNPTAIRAWQRAGFRPTGERGLDDGAATEILVYQPDSVIGTR